MVSLLAFILPMFWPKKLLDRVGLLYLTVTFSKIRLDYFSILDVSALV